MKLLGSPCGYLLARRLRASAAIVFGVAVTACAGSAVRRLALVGSSASTSPMAEMHVEASPYEARRWAEDGQGGESTLRVWVQPRSSNAPLGADSATVGMIQRAFHAWDPSQIPLSISQVSDSGDADIVIVFLDHFENATDGYTTVVWDRHGVITHGLVQLALHKHTGEALSDSAKLAVVTHEVGHALGLGHSRDTADVMAPIVRVTHPTRSDLAALRAIYFGKSDSTDVLLRAAGTSPGR